MAKEFIELLKDIKYNIYPEMLEAKEILAFNNMGEDTIENIKLKTPTQNDGWQSTTEGLLNGDIVLIDDMIVGTGAIWYNIGKVTLQDNAVLYLDTIEELITNSLASIEVSSVNVKGYATANDGGGGTFNYDSTIDKSTANGGIIIDPSVSLALQGTGVGLGCWVRQYSGAVNVKWFKDVQSAIDTGLSVEFTNIDISGVALQFNQANCTYTFRNSSILLDGSGGRLATISANGVRFRDAVFSGNNNYVSQALVNVDAGVKDFEFVDCIFKDINVGIGENVNSTQYGLHVTIQGAEGVVRGCSFKNINHYNHLSTATSAFCGGIMLQATLAGDRCKISISDTKFDNIWTDNISGDINLADADGIRVFGDNLIATDIVISNTAYYGVQKSGIKVSGATGLSITNTTVRASRTDVPMISAIRLQNSDYTKVDGLVAKGNFSIVMNIRSVNVDINNVLFYKSGISDPILFQVQSDISDKKKNITFRNIQAYQPFRLLNIDNIGVATEDAIAENISIENLVYEPSLNMSHSVIAINVDNINLKNIKLDSSVVVPSINMQLTDCNDITIDDCDLDAVQQGLLVVSSGVTVNGNDLVVRNCSAKRDVTAQVSTERFIQVQNTPDNVRFENMSISVPSYDTLSNTEAISIDATNVKISDIKLVTRNEGGGTHSISMILVKNCTNLLASDIMYDMQDATIQTNTYALYVQPSEKVNISNINSNSRGVHLSTSNNVAAVNIASVLSTFIDASATNVTKSNIATWV